MINSRFFMKSLLGVKNLLVILLLPCIFCLWVLFTGCAAKQEPQFDLSKSDRNWMKRFFNEILFVESGSYVLWGSKPVTEIVLYHFSEEEFIEMNSKLEPKDLENCYISEDYKLPEDWEKWEKFSNQIKLKNYLLYHSHFSPEDPKISYAYFVNIIEAAKTIQKHYDLFFQAVGFDFHPVEVVLDMPNQDSKFWNAVRDSKLSPLISGILFGFGEDNAFAYYWKCFDRSKQVKDYFKTAYSKGSTSDPIGQVIITHKNFELPRFISFFRDDPVKQRYLEEQRKIKEIYSKGDIVDITLERLLN